MNDERRETSQSGSRHIAIIGSGPAGLMAATVLAQNGIKVTIYEKKRGPAAKLLIAGRSGLNISHNCQEHPIWEYYTGPREHFKKIFENFSVKQWLEFVQGLGIETFEGTSRRYFVKGLKAAPLLKSWINHLKAKGVKFLYGMELTDFSSAPKGRVSVEFNGNTSLDFDAVCLCLGGASWERQETPLRWPEIFRRKGVGFADFSASNAGYEVDWSPDFIKEAGGLPLKNVAVISSTGIDRGEIVITAYGLEGTPVYNIKSAEKIYLDLKADLSLAAVKEKLAAVRENLSPIRRIKKGLKLCPAALALLHHQGLKDIQNDLDSLASLVKKFPIVLKKRRGLEEAISSAGGVLWQAADDGLMLKKFPGVFVAGEMLDWDAPTGGFLIQACVSQGDFAGRSILDHLKFCPAAQAEDQAH